jgi:hypothetical protein
VLILSFVNLARNLNLPASNTNIHSSFTKALNILLDDNANKSYNIVELQEICDYYISYMEEEAMDAAQLKQLKDIR